MHHNKANIAGVVTGETLELFNTQTTAVLTLLD